MKLTHVMPISRMEPRTNSHLHDYTSQRQQIRDCRFYRPSHLKRSTDSAEAVLVTACLAGLN